MTKIGLMGGTFDPIHKGHIALAKQAYEEFDLDQILFIPNHIPWMKKDRQISSDHDRAMMVEAAIADIPEFSVSYIEMDKEGDSYTADTVLELHAQNPDCEYYFIMGADSLFSIEKWYRPEVIFQNSILLVAVRDDCNLNDLEEKKNELSQRFMADIRLMHMDKIEISSTMIREKFYTDLSIRELLPDKVATLIEEKNLYHS